MKTIYHTGSWNRNYGDRLIQLGVHQNYERALKAVGETVHWVDVNIPQTTRHDPAAEGTEVDHGAWFNEALVEEVNREADMLVVGGGGLIMNREDGPFQVRMCEGGWQALRVPVVFQSIGWNEFRYNDDIDAEALWDYLLKPLTERSARTLFSVRNIYSRNRLPDQWMNTTYVIPDPALCVEPANYRGIYPHRLRRGMKVGLCWASDRREKRWGDDWQHVEDMALGKLLHMLRKTKATVYHMPHIAGHDQVVSNLLQSVLGSKRFVDLEAEPGAYPPDMDKAATLAGLYGKMDVVLGMRKHSVLGPIGQGTPAICLCTQPEIEASLREMMLSTLYVGDRSPWWSDRKLSDMCSYRYEVRQEAARARKQFDHWLQHQVLPLLVGAEAAA